MQACFDFCGFDFTLESRILIPGGVALSYKLYQHKLCLKICI
jgi:hypothetical protein